MRGGVLQEFDLVPGARNDAVPANNHRTDGYLSGVVSLDRLAQGLTHENAIDLGVRDIRLR